MRVTKNKLKEEYGALGGNGNGNGTNSPTPQKAKATPTKMKGTATPKKAGSTTPKTPGSRKRKVTVVSEEDQGEVEGSGGEVGCDGVAAKKVKVEDVDGEE